MATVVKRKLSGSTDGRGIKVVQTATAGDTIHTAVAGQTAGTYDEITLFAYNDHASAVLLTIEWGGVTVPDDILRLTIPSQSGDTYVIAGKILQNSVVVRAFAATTNVIVITGYVNSITD